jgi:hypothetical protein
MTAIETPPDPPPEGDALDREVLAEALQAQVGSNRSRALVLDALGRFHARRVAEKDDAGGDRPAFFGLTPLEATKAELGPLLGMGDQLIESNLELVEQLTAYFPRMWSQCLEGRMDIGRASLAVSYLGRLAKVEDRVAYAQAVENFLAAQDDATAGLHPVRYSNLQQACWRRARRFEQVTKDESFKQAFAKRRVRLRTDEHGMGSLVATTRVDHSLQADYRLTLIARKRAEADGENRTIEQLRVDTMIDLILGRVTVAAGDADLEDGETAEGVPVGDPTQWRDIGQFARPIVNVTVPITTLMGLGDTPGMLAGGTPVPAELATMIAEDPGSVWHRLLTDRAGGFVELSTDTYQCTKLQWKWTVAENPQCVWPTCRRPSTVTDLDHREPYPVGRTSTRNLQPLCERHHKIKHSRGFSVVREADGSYTWTSRFGVVSKKQAPEFPIAEWPEGHIVRVCRDHASEGQRERDEDTTTAVTPTSVMEQRFAALIAEAA